MSEETQINLNDQSKTGIKETLLNNKKYFISLILIFLIALFSYFFYVDFRKDKKVKISEKYNLALINHDTKNKNLSINEMLDIISTKDPTYSPLALYFILDNDIETSNEEINKFFDIIINEINLDKEIKNLIIYKKALFNADFENENNLLKILNPVINSDSVWKSHALYLLAEYFFDKNQKQKAKEFYSQILNYKKSNENILIETQKRLRRDFGE